MAALAYLAAYGARTPPLALRGLLRVRNLALVLAPALALAAVAIGSAGLVSSAVGIGMLSLALAPAPLPAADLVTRAGRRGDLAGALALGTVILSFVLLVPGRLLPAASVVGATQVFVIAAVAAAAIPVVRDRLLGTLRWVGWIAMLATLVLAAAGRPSLDLMVVVAALALAAAGAAAAALTARLTGRDALAAIGGAGLRDPALAAALALGAGGADAAAVPLVYTVFCLVLGAIVLRTR